MSVSITMTGGALQQVEELNSMDIFTTLTSAGEAGTITLAVTKVAFPEDCTT